MTSKHNCSGKIWGDYRDVSGRVYSCVRNATVERGGEWYCWQHDPGHVAADKKKRRAAEDAKQARRSGMYARRAHNARLGPLVTEELAELLEQLADEIPVLHTAMRWAGKTHPVGSEIVDKARAIAARIRGALEEKPNV